MSAYEATARCLARVDEHEHRVRAWAHLDRQRALAEATAADQREPGLMTGLVFGAKDIFDTADQPTAYGCQAYIGHRPVADAAAVALLRQAGAVCLGKTVTAELACFTPGPTTNPHRSSHTPGGSSMGSAAAVACGMVDLALGTQTAASVVRPASYCGVLGFKPTYGSVATAGTKTVAPSLDTVGWFANDPSLLALAFACLTGRSADHALAGPPRVGVVRTDQWEHADADSRQALEAMAERLAARGAGLTEMELPDELTGLAEQHAVVMEHEAARSLAYEASLGAPAISEVLLDLLERGRAISPAAYDAARAQAGLGRGAARRIFDEVDVLVTPAACGEAPPSLATTGDPLFGRPWALLGLPVVAVPSSSGRTGMPVGVQVVGPAGGDALLLGVLRWLGPPVN